MNDASGDNVEHHVKALEAEGKELPKEVQHDKDHLDPSRWWFASAAFPMIGGTLGPVASAFSICALVRPWRQSYVPGSDVTIAPFIDDPSWLTIINAVQLAIAIVANLALLLNMTRRLRFSIAQPVTIVGWYISSVCLLALTATAAGPLVIEPADAYVWSQAFYYAIYSASLYFLVASLMLVTFLGAEAGRYEKDFMLTPSQRTLMLQTISFLIYLLVGALIFCNIEDWNYLDGMYWAAVTLFTVGFGDIYPTTDLGRALLFPYSLIGIISLGLVIGSIRSLVLDRGKHRLDARMMERKRRAMLRRMTLKGKDNILIPIRSQQTGISSLHSSDGSSLTEFERREKEFRLMRKIQHLAARRRRWSAMAISGGTWITLWLAGAKIFQECEDKYQGWTYFDGAYFAFVSLTTIGYGDITPVSNAGRSFWVFWAFLALPTTTVLISNAGDTIVKGIREMTDEIAMITILPGEGGFRTNLRRLLKKLSFGILFEEDIEDEPAAFLGGLPRAHIGDDDEEDDDDEEEGGGGGMEKSAKRSENDAEAEAAGTVEGRAKKALEARDEETHARRVYANASAEGNVPKPPGSPRITFTKGSLQRPTTARSSSSRPPYLMTKSDSINYSTRSLQSSRPNISRDPSHPLKLSRTVSFPRQIEPNMPTNKADYHVMLIEEIGRVMQHLKKHPPRKYTFQEWAWYLRLIGEDESNAERHRMAEQPRLTRKKMGMRMKKDIKSESEKDVEEGEGQGTATATATDTGYVCESDSEGRQEEQDKDKAREIGEEDKKKKEAKKQWSWVGIRSPLMGSQEEAEWILEKLTERLKEELAEDAKSRRHGLSLGLWHRRKSAADG